MVGKKSLIWTSVIAVGFIFAAISLVVSYALGSTPLVLLSSGVVLVNGFAFSEEIKDYRGDK